MVGYNIQKMIYSRNFFFPQDLGKRSDFLGSYTILWIHDSTTI